MRILKTNTAVKICVGPLLDVTDGITPELTATVANMSAEIVHEHDDGSGVTRDAFTPAAAASNNDMIPVASSVMGFYDLELTQSNTNFLGRAKFAIIDTDVMLPYFEDWFVVSANVFDSMMGTDLLDTNTAQILNTACHASSENGTQCVEVVRWDGHDVSAHGVGMEGIPKVDIAAYRSTAAHTETTAGLIPAELHQVLGQSVTCAAGVTVLASVGAPAAPGAAGGLTTVAAGGVKQQQTVDLTAGQSIACADKTGFALSATGADLILKNSTFALAIADAIWEETVRTLTANTNLANLEVDLTKIHGTAITETAGQIAAAFTKLFDVAVPVFTCESVNQVQDNATTAEIKTAIEAAGGSIALIKAKTDSLTFTVANELDAPETARRLLRGGLCRDGDVLESRVMGS